LTQDKTLVAAADVADNFSTKAHKRTARNGFLQQQALFLLLSSGYRA
jgi:hypothetical protein